MDIPEGWKHILEGKGDDDNDASPTSGGSAKFEAALALPPAAPAVEVTSAGEPIYLTDLGSDVLQHITKFKDIPLLHKQVLLWNLVMDAEPCPPCDLERVRRLSSAQVEAALKLGTGISRSSAMPSREITELFGIMHRNHIRKSRPLDASAWFREMVK